MEEISIRLLKTNQSTKEDINIGDDFGVDNVRMGRTTQQVFDENIEYKIKSIKENVTHKINYTINLIQNYLIKLKLIDI
jgi:hypothetical protein